MLSGSYTHNIDTKNRVSVPVKFRGDLGVSFHVCCWNDDHLRIYSEKNWDKVLRTMRKKNPDAARKLSRASAPIDTDPQGRFVIPDELKKRAGLAETVEFIGMRDWVEMWTPFASDDERIEFNEKDAAVMNDIDTMDFDDEDDE